MPCWSEPSGVWGWEALLLLTQQGSAPRHFSEHLGKISVWLLKSSLHLKGLLQSPCCHPNSVMVWRFWISCYMSERTSQGSELHFNQKRLNLRLGFFCKLGFVSAGGLGICEWALVLAWMLLCCMAGGLLVAGLDFSWGMLLWFPSCFLLLLNLRSPLEWPLVLARRGWQMGSPQLWGWHGLTLAASSLCIRLHKPCLSVEDATCRGLQVPLGEPLHPHTMSSSALSGLWGFSQKTKSFGKCHKLKLVLL